MSWKQRYRPAGGWPLYAIVLVLSVGLGVGTAVSYYAVTRPPQVKVIIPKPLISTRPPVVIHLPTPHASTHTVTAPPVTLRPVYVPPSHPPPPSPSLSSGAANVPGTTPYSPIGGDTPPPPDTNTPIPGVTAPLPSPTSPSQGGF